MSNPTPPNLQNKIVEFMNTESPLRQVFVMDCLLKVSKAIIEHKEEVRENMKDSPLHPDAWIGCAEDAVKHFSEY